MSRTLKVRLTMESPDLVHDFRNFGEDVYGALGHECSVSIDEIDAATQEFHLREIPKRKVRTVAAMVHKLVENYKSLTIEIVEIEQTHNG